MDRDYYRCLSTEALLDMARSEGINTEMAIVMAERLDVLSNEAWNYGVRAESMGGRYTFNRSENA